MIDSFNKEYRFLSNFYPSVVEYAGHEYKSVEHAYQAAKADNPADRRRIREAEKPGEAKKLGQKVKMLPNWEQIKLSVMEELVRQKFTRHKDLQSRLLGTGDEELAEGNLWNDKYWGTVKGNGHNHLGKILMKIRAELKSA